MIDFIMSYFPPEFRKLAEAGGANTISEAKRALLKAWHECFSELEVVNAIDLTTVGRAKMRGLVSEGLARPMFEPWPAPDAAVWVVTQKAWTAELALQPKKAVAEFEVNRIAREGR